MTAMPNEYLLAGQSAELERLRLQSLVWESATRAMLATVPVQQGWRCVDVGCGAIGVLRPLSEAVGPSGSVLGVDVDPLLLKSAEDFIAEHDLRNVQVRQCDIFAELPGEHFDLVHLRFMFAPIGREQELLARAVALCRPGGYIVVQEPDGSCWSLIPPADSFDRLKRIIFEAFRAGGGDFNVGRRTYALLQLAGLEDVRIRAAVEALQPGHPYLAVVLQFAASLRQRILNAQIATESELDQLTSEVRELLDRGSAGTTFLVTQVSARAPGARADA
jgi:SAM-dependent methyltransferase